MCRLVSTHFSTLSRKSYNFFCFYSAPSSFAASYFLSPTRQKPPLRNQPPSNSTCSRRISTRTSKSAHWSTRIQTWMMKKRKVWMRPKRWYFVRCSGRGRDWRGGDLRGGGSTGALMNGVAIWVLKSSCFGRTFIGGGGSGGGLFIKVFI